MKIAILGSTGMLGSMVAGYLGRKFKVVTPEFDAITMFDLPYMLEGWIGNCPWVINAIGAIPQRCRDASRFVILNAEFPATLALVAVSRHPCPCC